MAQVEKISKTDALVMIYNQAIQQLVASQLDEKMMKHMQLLSTAINPELSKNLMQVQDTISKLNATLIALDQMIDAENKTSVKVRESN